MRVKEPSGPWNRWQTAGTVIMGSAAFSIFAGMMLAPYFVKFGQWAALLSMLGGLFFAIILVVFAVGCGEHASIMLNNFKQQKREDIANQENVNGMGI